ncbi:hypothetical protein [Janthinobacterium sp.]|uniref:hypothetical protein n=1 Tax=Janthinobacterium sp. TaxID=1871054 RepID=UPI00293D660A|nr:hypothetical protein [Janthinobacterium sp.]
MTRASATADWDALAAVNTTLANELPALAARGPWSADEQALLAQLRASHAQAFQACSQEKERLGLSLGDMHANKEGRLAYALIEASDPDGNEV